jgi:hypothetical protein
MPWYVPPRVWLTRPWIWWRGLRAAQLLLAVAAPAAVVEWRCPLPWLDSVSFVMVVVGKKKRRRLQLRHLTSSRTRGASGRRWHAWRPSWHQAPHSRRRHCATLVMEAARCLMSLVMVQQFLQFPISYHRHNDVPKPLRDDSWEFIFLWMLLSGGRFNHMS